MFLTHFMQGNFACFYPRHLLITFANSLNPDQAKQNIPDLGPNCLSLSDGTPER